MADCFSRLLVIAQAAKPAEQGELSGLSPWLLGILLLSLVLVPFGLGTLIANSLKLKDLGFKFGVVLFALVLGLAPFVSQYVVGSKEQSNYETRHANWQKKEDARKQITDEGVAEFKEALPAADVLRREQTKTSK